MARGTNHGHHPVHTRRQQGTNGRLADAVGTAGSDKTDGIVGEHGRVEFQRGYFRGFVKK